MKVRCSLHNGETIEISINNGKDVSQVGNKLCVRDTDGTLHEFKDATVKGFFLGEAPIVPSILKCVDRTPQGAD
jgi:hypothetical protein